VIEKTAKRGFNRRFGLIQIQADHGFIEQFQDID